MHTDFRIRAKSCHVFQPLTQLARVSKEKSWRTEKHLSNFPTPIFQPLTSDTPVPRVFYVHFYPDPVLSLICGLIPMYYKVLIFRSQFQLLSSHTSASNGIHGNAHPHSFPSLVPVAFPCASLFHLTPPSLISQLVASRRFASRGDHFHILPHSFPSLLFPSACIPMAMSSKAQVLSLYHCRNKL